DRGGVRPAKEQDRRAVRAGDPPGRPAALRAGDDEHGPRVTQHELDTPGRVLRVDGQVEGTGLQYAKQRDDQVSVTRQCNGHHLLRTDTPPDQVPGNLVSAVVQLRERQ